MFVFRGFILFSVQQAGVRLGCAAVSSLLLLSVAHADENLFGYVYGADTLPKGANEVYLWATHRADKGQGTYRATDYQLEFEHGITDKLTGSLYITGNQHKIEGAADLDEFGNPEYANRDSLRFNGVKGSLKYNFLSAYKDGIGFSVYVEPGYSTIHKVTGRPQSQYSLENKAILQKNFLDDTLVVAYNATLEFEKRQFKDDGEKEFEIEWEQSAGISYRVAPNWFAGLEVRNHTEWPEGQKEHSAYFLGPTIHYGGKEWWFTATWLPQISGKPIDPARSTDLHLGEHEKSEFRVKVGYNF